jgi:hypothetical protein
MGFQLTFLSVCKGYRKSYDTVVRWVALRVRNLDIFSSSFVSHQSSLGRILYAHQQVLIFSANMQTGGTI